MKTPANFAKLAVEAWCDGKEIILIGEPPDEGLDPTGELHHCDSMGCGLEHVVFRCDVTEDQATEAGYVVPVQEQPAVTDGQPSEARRKAMERQTEAGNHVITHEMGEG